MAMKWSVDRICRGPPVSTLTTVHIGQMPRSYIDFWTASASCSIIGGRRGSVSICRCGCVCVLLESSGASMKTAT